MIAYEIINIIFSNYITKIELNYLSIFVIFE